MKPELTLIPTLIINPSNIVVFNQIHWDPIKPSKAKEKTFVCFDKDGKSSFLESSRKAEGNVSTQAKRKLSKAIEYLVTTASEKKQFERIYGKTITFKVAFVTLTLPSKQMHPDSEITNTCLASLIDELKKYYNIKNYVWRAEKQKNGNIHYHLICDKFIPWSELRDRWNRIINKLGYVDRYQDFLKNWHSAGFKVRKDLEKTWPLEAQKMAYHKGKNTDFNNPNSTDIHSTKKIRNIKMYLTKYLTKNENKEMETKSQADGTFPPTGRIWGCNHELSKIQGYKAEIDQETAEELTKIIASKQCYRYETTYFSVYYIDYHKIKDLGAVHLFKYFSDYLFDKFNYSEQLKIAS